MEHTHVFLYGLFMDEALLRSKGLDPQGIERASVEGLALRIGRRATLVPDPATRVHGVVVSLTLVDLDRLYADPTVHEYRPKAVLARLEGGEAIPALSYVLPSPPEPEEHNPEYAGKLRALARTLGLPEEYVASIR